MLLAIQIFKLINSTKMKKIIFISTAILLGTLTLAQAKAIPQNVTVAFTAKYPNAVIKKWKQTDNHFAAEFSIDNKRAVAFYSADGNWERTETKIKWTWNLPSAVHQTLDKNGSLRFYIMDMKKVETPNGVIYIVHYNDGNTLDSDHHDAFTQYFLLHISETGELLKKEEVEH
jgi:hypothetical protein